MLVEPFYSRVTGAWTIVLARKIVGPNGEFLGATGRGSTEEPLLNLLFRRTISPDQDQQTPETKPPANDAPASEPPVTVPLAWTWQQWWRRC